MGAAAAFKDGPPPGHTGGFGEPTCRACHSEAGLNEPGGELSIAGVPRTYRPGRVYSIEVSLHRAGMLSAGFELAARFAGGGAPGMQAGTLEPVDGRTAIVWDTVTHVAYIEHTRTGTAVADGAARWVFRWTAPPADGRGAVVFHVAANAANDDDSPLGDLIYTASIEVAREGARPPARR